jgi:hypothetical protein
LRESRLIRRQECSDGFDATNRQMKVVVSLAQKERPALAGTGSAVLTEGRAADGSA